MAKVKALKLAEEQNKNSQLNTTNNNPSNTRNASINKVTQNVNTQRGKSVVLNNAQNQAKQI